MRFVGLVPAAGAGTRLSCVLPKQYLLLGAKTMLQHAIEAMLAEPRIERVYVVVAAGDQRWQRLGIQSDRVAFLAVGAPTRAGSVAAGLQAIADRVGDNDRVLVHDAARPCLHRGELARLIDETGDEEAGGLLAIPVMDTLKRAENGHVAATVARAELWCAQTPQMFRFGALRSALATALQGEPPTDEAGAMERAGHAPRLVAGASTNLKVTTADDLVLARAVLSEQGRL